MKTKSTIHRQACWTTSPTMFAISSLVALMAAAGRGGTMKRLLLSIALLFVVNIGFSAREFFMPAGGMVPSSDYEGWEKVKVLPRVITFPMSLN